MSVREYIGARYIMKFADPLQHDSTLTYEPLTVVQYMGASYISRQYVPAGIAITDTNYWLLLANYNVQIEQYRREVAEMSDTVDDHTRQLAGTQNSGLKQMITDAVTDINIDITNLTNQLDGTAESGLKTLIDTNSSDIRSLKFTDLTHTNQLAGTVTSGLKDLIQTNSDDIDSLETTTGTHTNQLAGTANSGLKNLIQTNSNDIDVLENKFNNKFVVANGTISVEGNSQGVVNLNLASLQQFIPSLTSFQDFINNWRIINIEEIATTITSNTAYWGIGTVIRTLNNDESFPYPHYSISQSNLMIFLYNNNSTTSNVGYRLVLMKVVD